MSCGMGVIKYLLFIFNFIFALCGLAILVLGVLAHLKLTHFAEAVKENVTFPSVTLIVVGSIIFVIAFFGCCGAIRESHCMTVTFASLLLTILIIQVAVAIYAFVVLKNDDIKKSITNVYANDIFKNYDHSEESRELVDEIQSALVCCGVKNHEDYGTIVQSAVPWSCCGTTKDVPCSHGNARDRPGCASKLLDFFQYAGAVLGGVALGVAAVELIGIIFALCLANSIKNEHRRGYRV